MGGRGGGGGRYCGLTSGEYYFVSGEATLCPVATKAGLGLGLGL